MRVELMNLIAPLGLECIVLAIFIMFILKEVKRLMRAKRNQKKQDGFGCEKISATVEGYKTESQINGAVYSHPIYAYDNNGEKATFVSKKTELTPSQDKIGKEVTLYRDIATGEVREDAVIEKKLAQATLIMYILFLFATQLFMLPFLLSFF